MPTPKRGSAWRGSLMESLWSHRKVHALTPKEMPDALALWLLAHSWVDYQRTDGEVPEGAATMLTSPARWTPARTRRAAMALVRVGLWDVIPGGWTFHDWSEHNLTAAERDEKLGAWSRAGELGGAVRAASGERGPGGRFVAKRSPEAPEPEHEPVADHQTDRQTLSGEGHQTLSGLGMGMGMGMETLLKENPRESALNGAALGIPVTDPRHPVAELLAGRFRFTTISAKQWELLHSLVDNEYPRGTKKGRDRYVGWRWMAETLDKAPRDAGDPIAFVMAEHNAEVTRRRAAAIRREQEWEELKAKEARRD